MRGRTLGAVATAAALTLTAIPHAQAAGPQVVDITGDANAVNGQGFLLGVNSPGTAASAASLDITSVQWATKFVLVRKGKKTIKTPTAVVVTLTAAGAIADLGKSAVWRATAAVGDCPFNLAYEVAPGFQPAASLRICDSSNPLGKDFTDIAVSVSGNKIVWTLPVRALPSYGVRVGTTLESLGAHTRLELGVLTEPQMDEAFSDKVYKIGS